MLLVNKYILPVVLVFNELGLFYKSVHLTEIKLPILLPLLLQTSTEIAYFRQHLSELRQHDDPPYLHSIASYHDLRCLQGTIQRRHEDDIDSFELMRHPFRLALECSPFGDAAIDVVLVELQFLLGLLPHKTSIRVVQGSLVVFRLGMAYHECLGEALVAVMAVASESASPLHVVPTYLNFVYFGWVSFHLYLI